MVPHKPDASAPADLAEQLLGLLRWRSSVFHAGSYCGRWQASTAGRRRASFHWVLDGACWLHRPGQAPLRLLAGQGLCLLSDEPHWLGPSEGPPESGGDRQPAAPMRAACAPDSGFGSGHPQACSLVCGFFDFEGPSTSLLRCSLPALLPLQQPGPAAQALLALMREELLRQTDPDRPGPVLQRLSDVLLMLSLRAPLQQALARRDAAGTAPGCQLLALAREPQLAPLLLALLEAPGADWSAERMAAHSGLSRASLFRLFAQTVDCAPAQFLLQLRMQLAAQRLREGQSIARTAEQLGYQSESAFSRAFQRVQGAQPGRFRRETGTAPG